MKKIEKSIKWLVKQFWRLRFILGVAKFVLLALGLFVFAAILWGVGLVLFFLKLIRTWREPELFYTTLAKVLYFAAERIDRIEISGKENIPKSGKALIAARHREVWDIPYLAIAALGRHKVKFIARKDMFWVKFLKPVQDFVIQIDRSNFKLSHIKKVLKALQEEELVGIFPEGTRDSPSEDKERYHPGLIKFAERGNAPIIPLNISFEGNHRSWLSRLWDLNSKLELRIGEPIEVSELKSRFVQEQDYREVPNKDYWKVTKYFMEEIVDKT